MDTVHIITDKLYLSSYFAQKKKLTWVISGRFFFHPRQLLFEFKFSRKKYSIIIIHLKYSSYALIKISERNDFVIT